jgi:hypothetical protein
MTYYRASSRLPDSWLVFTLTLMLDFKLLIINDVALWKRLLDSVFDFNSLAINDVTLVVLYMRSYTYPIYLLGDAKTIHL